MTDEEIIQKANEFATHINGDKAPFSSREYEAYIAGAHIRDEEIAYLTYRLNDTAEKLQTVIAERDNLRNPWISVEDGLPEKHTPVKDVEGWLASRYAEMDMKMAKDLNLRSETPSETLEKLIKKVDVKRKRSKVKLV